MRVVVTALAEQDILDEDEWWRANRDERDCFADEVAAALALLSRSPRVGARVRREAAGEVRRLTLRRSKRLVFYLVDDAAQTVHVLRVWGAPRRARPAL